MAILKLKPACKGYLWGGTKLVTDFHKEYDGPILAETWELSCHKDGESVIAEGPFAGKTLSEYIKERGKEILGENCQRYQDFPILIKLIDAKDNLSIQVHPNNAYALDREGQYGKTEMWYIVDCAEDATLYYGVKEPISKEAFRQKIENNTVLEALNQVPVKKGDVFFIEAGTVHAINKDIVIAEIQQNSNLTYRVYDYGRIGPDGKQRELHIDKACEVSNLYPNAAEYDFAGHLGACEYFVVDKIEVDVTNEDFCGQDSFHSLLFLNGSGTITQQGESTAFQKGDSIFISANSGTYTISGGCEYLLTKIGEKKYRIGIDLGGTNIKVGIVDGEKNIIAKKSIKTGAERPYQEIIKDMGQAVVSLLEESNISTKECIAIGIGSPGIVDAKKGAIVYANNLHWEYVPIASELQKYIDLPVHVSNDANCAALGEATAGAAKGCKDVLLFTLGTGIGGGAVIDGKIFEGGSPGGAELGHTVLMMDGELCTCGRKGCFEAYASATALIRNTKRAALAHPESKINELVHGNLEDINGITPFDAAKAGDAAAKEVVENYIKYLSEGIIDMINIFRPEKVLISGGVCNQGEYLVAPVNDYVKKYCYGGERVFIPTVSRATLGNDAGIIGAAMLG